MTRFLPRGGLWRRPDFMKLWSAESISQFGDQVTFLALPLIAITLLQASAFEVALVATVEFLPFILFTLPAGVWVDRLRRRPILIAADLGRAISLASVPIAFALGGLGLWQLYVVAFINGVLKVFFDVAYQSYLPAVVERDELIEGNAKLEMSRSAAQIAGPSVAGLLIGLATAPVAIAADAVSFLGSAAFLARIRRQEPAPERASAASPKGEGMRREVMAGLRYVLGNRYLRYIAASTALSNLFSNIVFAIFLVYAVRGLGLTPELIGLTFGLGNIGFLVGAILSSRIADRIGIGRTIIAGAAISAPAMLLIPLAPRDLAVPFLVASGALVSFAIAIYNINQVSLRQAITPERMQGRMNATMRFIVWGTIPIGTVAGGAIGTAYGLQAALWVGALGSFLAVVPLMVSTLPSLQRIPEPVQEPAPPGSDVAQAIDSVPEAAGGDRLNVGGGTLPTPDD